MKKIKCMNCGKRFKTRKQLMNHELQAHSPARNIKKKSTVNTKKIKNWAIAIIVIFLIGLGISQLGGQPKLPPTSMQGHIEENPASHILKTPMANAVQRHMLEHADGVDRGPGGIIINYDCKNFDCEQDLVTKLEAFAIKYPENVYVAPFKNMQVKIALTKLGRIETLDNYDESRIETFIGGR